jgi:hypothetical protein
LGDLRNTKTQKLALAGTALQPRCRRRGLFLIGTQYRYQRQAQCRGSGLVSICGQAIGDDSTPTSTPREQRMKDCMARQKATNSSMTQAAMETVCKNEAKNHKDKDGNDLATGPQAPKLQE